MTAVEFLPVHLLLIRLEKPLPPVFVDDVKEKDAKKDDGVDVEVDRSKKEDAMKDEDVVFESLPDRSSEVMKADFDPDPPAEVGDGR